jgi:predicted DNA-binding transcriptional regulator AlpA
MQDTPSSTFRTGDPLIRPAQMRVELGGIGESTLYEWVALGLIPPPVRMSRRVTGWPRSVVDAIKAARAAGELPAVNREAIRAQRRAARAQAATAVAR